MELEFAFLADAAKVEQNGIFNVLGGGFDVLRNTSTFPATKPVMVLLAKIKVTAEECKREHELLAELVAPDGAAIHPPIRARYAPSPNVGKPRPNSWIAVAFTYHNATFPAPGEYQFRLSVGDSPLGQVRLDVIAKESGS
jgi:hypothetical protein